ncbi:MAG: hypothetical protein HQ553_04960 [Chloroflexi bacterium]|nr:hypothetical protein [Chloroflexota bacterium]
MPYLSLLCIIFNCRDNNRPDRFISIGCDPQPYYAQNIIAVAIPVNAIITSIFDYQPYLSITLEEWNILYYDVTDISGHVSIHVTFEPAGNPPSLNWTEVEEAR